jgi:hypothetical protein
MSDTNRVALRVIAESVAGTTPATPAFEPVPFTGTTDLGATPETVVSDIIRSDRQVNDLIKVNESVGGQFDTELIPGAFDSLLLAALQGTGWSAETVIATGVLVTISGSNIDSTGAFTSGDIAVGDWIEVVQASGAPSYYRVAARNSDDDIDVEGTVSETTHASNIVITRAASATNGTTNYTFAVERAFEDINVWEYMNGMEVDSFSVSASASSLVTASFGLLGRSHTVQTSRFTGATTATEPSNGTFNASSNVATIGEAGTPGLQVCTEITMELTNSLRERNVLGVVGAASIGSGEFNVSGQLSVYFEDATMLEKLLNNTATSISFGFDDGAGNVLIFDMPKVKFSEGVPEVSGKNEDVMLNLGYQAYRDPTAGIGYTLKISKFSA